MTDKAQGAAAEREEMIEALRMCVVALEHAGIGSRTRGIAQRNAAEVLARAAIEAQPAPTEAQGGKLMELFLHTLGTLAVHDHKEAERIGKLYRGEGEIAAQGDDSARLDWMETAKRNLAAQGRNSVTFEFGDAATIRESLDKIRGTMGAKPYGFSELTFKSLQPQEQS